MALSEKTTLRSSWTTAEAFQSTGNLVESAVSFSAGQYIGADPGGKLQHVAKAGRDSYTALEMQGTKQLCPQS